MIDSLRDRSIIAACLVLYALGMLMVTIGHSHAHTTDVIAQGNIKTLSVLCSGDFQDQTAHEHCPYCRLADMPVAPNNVDFSQRVILIFTPMMHLGSTPVHIGGTKTSTHPRGPPASI